MNTINEICIYMIQLYSVRKIRFIKRMVINSKITKLKNILYLQDIFSLSNNVITFFSSIPQYIVDPVELNIIQEFMQIHLHDTIDITYNARRQEFEINDDSYGIYTISKHIDISKVKREKWMNIEYALKDFYINAILNTSKNLAKERVIRNE